VTLSAAEPGSVATAPADAAPWSGAAVPMEVELWLEEAFAAEGTQLHSTLAVSPDEAKTEAQFELVAADPLADGVDVTVRFFVSGYEVGRARTFIQNRDLEAVEPRAGAPGAVVVPDTILS